MNKTLPSRDSIVCAAIEIADADERAAFVARASGADDELRRRVDALVAAHFRAGNFLDIPAESHATIAALASGPDEVGSLIGPYKLLEQIGEGGMGIVYVAEQTEPVRRRVALKVIRPGMDSHEVIARFEAERQVLALMDHPNIARVLDAGSTDAGRPYFVMELVRGLPITEYCDQARLSAEGRLRLFAQVCRAVQHAHQKGIIHRDIKPSNVLITLHDGEPVPKVIDFGVAKAIGQKLTDNTVYTQFTQLIGTPLYMSPEQAELSALDVDTRSDIYSLGVLLYELLTGTTPFEERTLRAAGFDEMRRMIREEEPPRPSARVSTMDAAARSTTSSQRGLDDRQLSRLLRGDLDWIVMKALEKNRNRRYESASAFARDVERFLANEPVQARPPSSVYRLRKFAGRNKAALVSAGLAAALIATFGWALVDRAGRRAATDEVVLQALAEADDLQARQKYPEALAAAQRADGLAAGGASTMALSARARRRKTDLELLLRLDDVRLEKTAVGAAGKFDKVLADRRYGEEFRAAGIDLDVLSAEEAAVRLRDTAVAVELALALDSWADDRREVSGTDWKRLLQVARLADPDPWRCRLRDAVEAGDRKALEELPKEVRSARQSVRSMEALGDALWKANARQAAIAVFREAQRLHPGDFWVNHHLGWALIQSGPARRAEGLRFWIASVAVRPQSPAARSNLGLALAKAGEVDEALANLREAVRLKPDYVSGHNNLALVLMQKDQAQEALAILQKALPLNPNHANTHNNLGRVLSALGRADEAIAAYREAIRLQPDFSVAHMNLGATLCNLKRDFDGAITSFRDSLRLQPNNATCHHNLGIALYLKGLFDESVTAYQEAVRLQPGDVDLRVGLATAQGFAFKSQGRVDEAIVALREAVRIKPDDGQAHVNLGAVLCDSKKDYDGAIASVREAIRLDHRNANAHVVLGVAMELSGRPDEAMASYGEAVRLRPNNHGDRERLLKAQSTVAGIWFDQGRHAKSESLLQEAYALHQQWAADPRSRSEHPLVLGGICCNMGKVLKDMNRSADALIWYDRAIQGLSAVLEKEPGPVEARLNLRSSYVGRSLALVSLKRFTEALRDCDTALKIGDVSEQLSLRMHRVRCQSHVDPDGAAKAIEDVLQTEKTPPDDLYTAAVAYAVAYATAKDEPRRERYAVRAVDLLRKAQAAGHFNDPPAVANLGTEPDLDSLRKRDDFREFVRELGKVRE